MTVVPSPAARHSGRANPDLQFLPNDAGELEGLGDAGIETYRDNPYASIARECGQNSNDAAVKRPVLVCYDLVMLDSAKIPALPKLRTAVESCLSAAVKNGDEKTIDFFKHAKKVLGESKIKCLRVSDSNTTGLVGPCEPGKPFHSLVKSTGISTKDSESCAADVVRWSSGAGRSAPNPSSASAGGHDGAQRTSRYGADAGPSAVSRTTVSPGTVRR
jgi:hypothetical protein